MRTVPSDPRERLAFFIEHAGPMVDNTLRLRTRQIASETGATQAEMLETLASSGLASRADRARFHAWLTGAQVPWPEIKPPARSGSPRSESSVVTATRTPPASIEQAAQKTCEVARARIHRALELLPQVDLAKVPTQAWVDRVLAPYTSVFGTGPQFQAAYDWIDDTGHGPA
jgi:hypothetical protein